MSHNLSRTYRHAAAALLLALLSACGNDVPTLTATPNRKPGTAVYLLLDVSGSMGDSVPNAAGKLEPKLAIAKRAATDVCNAVAKFAGEDKSRTIQIAVASFSDDYFVNYDMAKPDAPAMAAAIDGLSTRGGTAIGDAVQQAQQALDKTGLKSQHILIVTDGENNTGITPENIATALNKLPAELRPTVYVVAFDVKASVFDNVKKAGWQIFSASNGTQLQEQLDEVVGGHILLEK